MHKNHSSTLFVELSPLNHLFSSQWFACPGHILESTKGIELGTHIDVNEGKCRRQEPLSFVTFYLDTVIFLFKEIH